MTKAIYFNNATTSWPKSEAVIEALTKSYERQGSSNRGIDVEISRVVDRVRRSTARFFGVNDSDRLIFQPSATYALNMIISGSLKAGDRVLVSRSEHNSVTRPLFFHAKERGAELVWIPVDKTGVIDLDFISVELKSERAVDAIYCQHASNVTGVIQPVAEVIKMAQASNTPVIVDGAQYGGHARINLDELGASAWVCSGHKALGGPTGIGVCYLSEGFDPTPLAFGGTGEGGFEVDENDFETPSFYEVGTEPLANIEALGAAIDELDENLEKWIKKETGLVAQLAEGLSAIKGVEIFGPKADKPRLPIVSISVEGRRADEVAFELSRRFNIKTRPGMHCAPALHEALGSFERGGLVRFSVSHHNDSVEVAQVIKAVQIIAAGA